MIERDLIIDVAMQPFNSKVKYYPDGSSLATYCNKAVFRMIPNSKPKVNKFEEFQPPLLSLDIAPLDNPYQTVEPLTGEVLLGKWSEENLKLIRNEGKTKKRRSDNVRRACEKIYDIVMLNEWDYFFTGTLNDEKFDPTSAKEALKPLQNWLKHMVNRYGLKYILVAEYQPKSGRIHFHGFINDVLKTVDSGRRLYRAPTDQRKKSYDLQYFEKNGLNADDYPIIYNIPQWKFGYTTAIKTYNGSQGCANYIQKYITKDSKAIFGRYYWSSRNLKRDCDMYFEDVDFHSLPLTTYSIPRTKLELKYYTFFPGEINFHWEKAAENSNAIIEELKQYDDLSGFEEVIQYDDLSDFEEV